MRSSYFWLLASDGQPFRNPVREGLPTNRPVMARFRGYE